MADLYRYFDVDGRLLYVGVSKSAVARMAGHASAARWWESVARMTRQTYPNRQAAADAEVRAIRDERPIYNVQHAEPRQVEVPVPKRIAPVPGGTIHGAWRGDAFSYTLKAAAALTGLSDDTLRRRAKEGRLRLVKVAGRTLVDGESLRALIRGDHAT